MAASAVSNYSNDAHCKSRKLQSPQIRLKKAVEVALTSVANLTIAIQEQVLSEIPRRWEIHSDLAILPRDAWSSAKSWPAQLLANLWTAFAQSLNVTRVAQRVGGSQNNDFRSPCVVFLWPPSCTSSSNDQWAERRENGILYSWPVTLCMFSAGNVSEKLRVAAWNCTDETVVDLYAGIGYWTLPLILHANAALVYACEWNPAAVEALRRNLISNKVSSERCIVLEGDNKMHAPRAVAQRVLLGLLPSSESGWSVACAALNPRTGGWLHVHGTVDNIQKSNDMTSCQSVSYTCNRRAGPRASWQFWIDFCVGRLSDLLCKDWSIVPHHLEKVKAYGPQVDHLVLDIECRPADWRC